MNCNLLVYFPAMARHVAETMAVDLEESNGVELLKSNARWKNGNVPWKIRSRGMGSGSAKRKGPVSLCKLFTITIPLCRGRLIVMQEFGEAYNCTWYYVCWVMDGNVC